MGRNFDVPTHVPADLTTAMGLVHVLVVTALLKLVPVLGQHIGRDDLWVVVQQAQGTAQAHAVGNCGFGNPLQSSPVKASGSSVSDSTTLS